MTRNPRPSVIAVGMFDSIHFVRWLEQFSREKIDFELIPSSPHRRTHERLRKLLQQSGQEAANFKIPRGVRTLSLPIWIADRVLKDRLRSLLIFSRIKKLEPDYLHAIEIQHAGYPSRKALERLPSSRRPVFMVTNYGSDIFWFVRYPRHAKEIAAVLALCDRYSAECSRDIKLAESLGFRGKSFPVRPNAGGFATEVLDKPLLSVENRKIILVKGYHGWVGRAKVALAALGRISEQISGYSVVLISCNKATLRAARKLSRETGLKIQAFGKKKLSHQEVLDLHAQASIFVGLSLSDGISTSMLEAMAMGSIPVQTSTACCDEWFTKTGVKVEDISVEAVADAIIQGLELANDPSNRNINRETIRAKASEEYVKDAALEFYR